MKLTRLGEIVFLSCLAIVAIETFIALIWIMDHINWVGDHYCFRSSLECYFGGK